MSVAISFSRERRSSLAAQSGTTLLVLGAVLVGIAIVAEGTVGRIINGLGGAAWLAAAALFIVALWKVPGWRLSGLAVAVVCMALALVVRPSDGWLAAAGFGAGGALAAGFSRAEASLWARLVPALWLPIHIGVAVIRGVVGASANGGPIRTDPPPTDALVSLVMVLAAWGGGLLVEIGRQRRWLKRQRPA